MELRHRFGRALRLAVIGGGPGSWIGAMHRSAAELDGAFRVCAAVLSSDAQRSRAAGALLGLDGVRCYGDVPQLLEAEARRDDGVEAVAIMTPNDTHHGCAAAALDAGLDVICDKPVSHDLAQALDLMQRVHANRRLPVWDVHRLEPGGLRGERCVSQRWDLWPRVRFVLKPREVERDGV